MKGGVTPVALTAGSDQTVLDGASVGVGTKLMGFDVVPDGTNTVEIIIYDGPAASGPIIARGRAAGLGPSVHVRFEKGVAISNTTATTGGLRATVTGTNGTAVVYYEG